MTTVTHHTAPAQESGCSSLPVKNRIASVVCVVMLVTLVFGPAVVSAPKNDHSAACPFEGNPTGPTVAQDASVLLGAGLTAVGDPVDMDAALVAGADYVRHAQADVTEDNALNGNPDVPDDPDTPAAEDPVDAELPGEGPENLSGPDDDKNSLGEMSFASPAIAGDSLFVRTQTKLYRITDAP